MRLADKEDTLRELVEDELQLGTDNPVVLFRKNRDEKNIGEEDAEKILDKWVREGLVSVFHLEPRDRWEDEPLTHITINTTPNFQPSLKWEDFEYKPIEGVLCHRKRPMIVRGEYEPKVVEYLFNERPKERVAENDINEHLGPRVTSPRAAEQAVRRINRQAQQDLGIKELLINTKTLVWVNAE